MKSVLVTQPPLHSAVVRSISFASFRRPLRCAFVVAAGEFRRQFDERIADPLNRQICSLSWNDDEVVATGQVILPEPKCFANEAFDAVPANRPAVFPTHRKPQPRVRQFVRRGVQEQQVIPRPLLSSIRRLKIAPTPEMVRLRKRQHRRSLPHSIAASSSLPPNRPQNASV